MKKQIIKNKKCRNCKHFVEYYIRRSNYFQATKSGYCSNEIATDPKITITACDHFEIRNYNLEKQERLTSATRSLAVISEMLAYLTQCFKAEEEFEDPESDND